MAKNNRKVQARAARAKSRVKTLNLHRMGVPFIQSKFSRMSKWQGDVPAWQSAKKRIGRIMARTARGEESFAEFEAFNSEYA
jgi:hypothetical protein